MRKDYQVEERVEGKVWLYTFKDINTKGEKVCFELIKTEDDPTWKNSLAKLWKKNGFIDRVLETHWSIKVYCYDTEGYCYGRYNPQSKLSEDGKRAVINFDWMFEATEENKEKLINEVYRLFMAATGKTATEEKIDHVKKFAKENGLEVVTEIPEGWMKTSYATDPRGSISVCNMKMSLKALHDGTYQRKLLLI